MQARSAQFHLNCKRIFLFVVQHDNLLSWVSNTASKYYNSFTTFWIAGTKVYHELHRIRAKRRLTDNSAFLKLTRFVAIKTIARSVAQVWRLLTLSTIQYAQRRQSSKTRYNIQHTHTHGSRSASVKSTSQSSDWICSTVRNSRTGRLTSQWAEISYYQSEIRWRCAALLPMLSGTNIIIIIIISCLYNQF